MSETKSTTSAGSSKIDEDGKAKDADPRDVDHVETSAGEGSRKGGGLDSMLDQLVIDEEEFDNFVIEEDEAVLVENTRWMAIARVLIGNNFIHEALFQQMQNAWNPAHENYYPCGGC
jgi:hypothetical protein